MKKITNNNKGFSLIELIIVIAIMAVLVAIIAPNLTKYLGSSKKNADTKNLDEIEATLKTCITDFEMSHGDFISTTGTTITVTFGASGCTVSGTSNDADAKAAIDTAIEAAKTQSKVDTTKYATADITKNSDGSYTIKAKF